MITQVIRVLHKLELSPRAMKFQIHNLLFVWRRPLTDWHTSELSFLGFPRQISFTLTKVVIHRLNFLLKLSAP